MIELAGVARDNEAMQDIFEKYDNDITLVFEFESDTRADVFYVDDAIDGGRLVIQIRRKWNHEWLDYAGAVNGTRGVSQEGAA